MAYPYNGTEKVTVADGHGVSITKQTRLSTVTIMALWAQAVIQLAVAVLSGAEGALLVGFQTLLSNWTLM